jgi:hypothetical protein
MKKSCSFLLVCLFLTACRTPQQVVLKQTVTIRDTITVLAPVPPTENVAVDWFPLENMVDSFFVEDSTSFAEVIMRVDTVERVRYYTVRHGRKADTVFVTVPIVLTDTFFIKTGCPPCPELMPESGKFPWALVLVSLGALALFFTVGRKKRA